MKTKLSTILNAIRGRLLDLDVFPPERCFLSLRMNVPVHFVAEQYAIILPLTQTFDESFWDGGGRYDTLVRGRMNVYVRNRLAVDEAYRDTSWLTDSTNGALDKLHEVMDALSSFIPIDDNGNNLLEEPMRPVFCMEPRKDYDNPEWGECMVEYEIAYRLNLTIIRGDRE